MGKTCKGKACYRRKIAGTASKKRRRAFKKKMKVRSVLRKKCGKCMKGKAKCTGKCKKFKNRRRPKSRKTCKTKVCYLRERALKASNKRRVARAKCFKDKKCMATYRARRSRSG